MPAFRPPAWSWFANGLAGLAFGAGLLGGAFPGVLTCPDLLSCLSCFVAPFLASVLLLPMFLIAYFFRRFDSLIFKILLALAALAIVAALLFEPRLLTLLCCSLWWAAILIWGVAFPVNRRKWLAPVLGFTLVALLWTNIPLKISFWIHKPLLEQLLAEVKDQKIYLEPRRAGIYHIYKVNNLGRPAFIYTDWNVPMGQHQFAGFGFASSPERIPKGISDATIVDLREGWYAEAYSD